MQNHWKQLFCLFLTLCMVLSLVPVGAMTASAEELEEELEEALWEEDFPAEEPEDILISEDSLYLPEEEEEAEEAPEILEEDPAEEELAIEEEVFDEDAVEPEAEPAEPEVTPVEEEALPDEEELPEDDEFLDDEDPLELLADDFESTVETWINPAYADIVDPESLAFSRESLVSGLLDNSIPKFSSMSEGLKYVRRQMVARTADIYAYFTVSSSDPTDRATVVKKSFDHTGIADEGDALYWEMGGYSYNFYQVEGNVYLFYIAPQYYTTAAQEAQLTSQINSVLSSMNMGGKTEYQRIKAIYDYICHNITYDFDSSGKMKHTAYAAMIKKTSVCQGYASLFYRMALASGLSCRVVAGTGNGGDHGWNIVRIGSYYYDVDSTWDSQNYGWGYPYQYFLKIDSTFGDHQRWSQYATSAFKSQYPMASKDYNPNTDANGLGQLATPMLTSVANVSNGVTVKWNSVIGASKYRVFYKTSTGSWTKAGDTSSTSFTKTGLNSGWVYYFTVRCLSGDSCVSGYNTTGLGIRYYAQPVLVSVTNASNGVTVKWNAVPGVSKYRVFYKTSTGSWTKAGDTSSTSFTKTGLNSGWVYYFTVRCLDGDKCVSAYDTVGKSIKYQPTNGQLAAPVLTSVASASNGVTVKWNAVPGASVYRVFYKTTNGSWMKAGDTTGTFYTVTGLNNGWNYWFTVRCISADGSSYTSNYNAAGVSCKFVGTPQLVSAATAANGVTVKWNTLKNAAKYRVFYKTTNGSWTKAGDTTGTSYTVTGLNNGWMYWFTVRAIAADGSSYTSNYNTAGLSCKFVGTPVLTSVSNASNGVTVKWNTLKNAAKYRVFYKTTNGNWTKAGDTTGTSYTVTGLISGWTYWFTVRAITADGSSYTSNYDAAGKSIRYTPSVPTTGYGKMAQLASYINSNGTNNSSGAKELKLTTGSTTVYLTYDQRNQIILFSTYTNRSDGAQANAAFGVYISSGNIVDQHAYVTVKRSGWQIEANTYNFNNNTYNFDRTTLSFNVSTSGYNPYYETPAEQCNITMYQHLLPELDDALWYKFGYTLRDIGFLMY